MTVPPLAMVGHGSPATEALADLLHELKSGDPLRPVTVAVPHPWAGLFLRRALAARGNGIANVNFLVLARVAELIGAPTLAAGGARPRTSTVTRAAVRSVLRDAPGSVLASVADHPATEAAVTRLVDELGSIDPGDRGVLAARGARAADLTALVERVIAAAPHRYDRHDLARSAAAVVRSGAGGLDELGHVVVHLPTALTAAEVDLIAALAGLDLVHVLIGITGDAHADRPALRLCDRLAPALGDAAVVDAPSPPVAQAIVTTTDPDDEVRAALREVVAAWEAGTPLERIAIVHSSPDPYARLVSEQTQAAGIPMASSATSTLARSVAGRALLGALDLPATDFARDAVCDWMASAPMHHGDGRLVPTSRWDDLSRQAGVVAGGIDAWNHHLDALLDRLTDRYARFTRSDDGPDERLERDRRQIEALRSFVASIDSQLSTLAGLDSWSEMAVWATSFLRSLLGSEAQRGDWPEEQFAASDAVVEALERLAALDEVEAHPDAATFRRALGAELDTSFGRVGSVGRGLLVVPLRHAVGLDLDLVVVLGMAEGTLPGRTRDDALLPDADRDAVGGGLARRADAVVDQHHSLLAALSAAPTRVLMSPRGDLRQNRQRVPSRWLLDSVSANAGRTITTRDFDDVDLPSVRRVPSFASGVTDTAHPVSLDERDLADLHRWVAGGHRPESHPLVADLPGLASGFEVLDSRRHLGFNRFTGAVQGVDIPTFRSGAALSPTALQRWAECPRKYFFSQVLRVRTRETPEYVDRISAASKGSLVHDVLDRFFTEVIARPEPKSPSQPWSEAERARAAEIFDQVCLEFEDEGLVGRRILWALDRADIAQELERFFDSDEAYRLAEGAVPVATELPFGPDAPSGALLELPGGRRVSFRGFADRVDRRSDGSLVVLDYKTGRLDKDVAKISEDPTFVGGTKLQLPVYALAAAAAHGGPDTPVRAAYWHITSRSDFAQAGYDAHPDRQAHFVDVVTHIADGIEGGVFPAYPGDPDTWQGGFTNCRYCDFDAVCGRNRLFEWERVRHAPEVGVFVELRGLTIDTEDGAE